MEILNVAQGEFKLSRYPSSERDLLRAWDAADEYILQHLPTLNFVENTLKVLIVNDAFGALATALAKYDVTVWTDSYLTEMAIKINATNNEVSASKRKILKSIDTPEEGYDLVLIKLPKSQALLEDQLYRLRSVLNSSTTIIATGMVKNVHSSTLALFEKIIGPTKTSLAKKKARLIFCQLDEKINPAINPYPLSYKLDVSGETIVNHANVFSREKLDIGTRLLLQELMKLPATSVYENIIDLGCGNGVLGVMLQKQFRDASISYLDESYMAIASAEQNHKSVIGSINHTEFKITNCLDGVVKNSTDLIVNNPPFHQNTAVGDEMAWQMFKQSREVLKPNGELWVVGNRHLAYHSKLKRLFSNCETIASNKKFVVLKSVKI